MQAGLDNVLASNLFTTHENQLRKWQDCGSVKKEKKLMICPVSFAEIMPLSGKIQETPKSNQLVVKLLEIPYHHLHQVSAHINHIRNTEDGDTNQII
jgi:hypothetical protein